MKSWLVIVIGFLFAILPNVYAQESIPSPLKQLNSGVAIQDVKCKEGFVLIINAESGEPICAKPASTTRLLSHGWMAVEKFQAMKSTLQPYDTNTFVQDKNKDNVTIPTGSNSINETQSNCAAVSDDFKGSSMYPILVTPKIISSSGYVKIMCLAVSSNHLKVGDNAFFGMDVKNISNGPIQLKVGPCFSSEFYTLSPEDHVQEFPCPRTTIAVGEGIVAPNIHGVLGGLSGHLGGWYKITKPGMLTVTIELQSIIIDKDLTYLNNITNQSDYNMKVKQIRYGLPTSIVTDTLQFHVNVIDNETNSIPVSNQVSNNNVTSITNIMTENKTISHCSEFQGFGVGFTPSDELLVTPVTSSLSGYVKILCIEMSPNPLKVGNTTSFGLDMQNISNGPLWFRGGIGLSSLYYTISPQENVQEFPPNRISKIADWMAPAPPNDHGLLRGLSGHLGGWYKITKPGMLTVTMVLQSIIIDTNLTDLNNVTDPLDYERIAHHDFFKWYPTKERIVTDTIQFDVNAT